VERLDGGVEAAVKRTEKLHLSVARGAVVLAPEEVGASAELRRDRRHENAQVAKPGTEPRYPLVMLVHERRASDLGSGTARRGGSSLFSCTRVERAREGTWATTPVFDRRPSAQVPPRALGSSAAFASRPRTARSQ